MVEFDADKNVISIEEKPKTPKSNYAVTGLYLYDENVSEIARNIKPSHRGELEITAMNREYMKQEKLQVEVLGRGFTWLDAGTPETLLEATHFVSTMQERQGLKISCIEEIAYRLGYIDSKQLLKLTDPLLKTEYGNYLLQVTKEEIKIIIEQSSVPVVVDAGIGVPSDAAAVMEMGADAVLVNTAIAQSSNPGLMAEAFKQGVTAGRKAYLAGRMPIKETAVPSSPIEGVSKPA